MAPRGIVVSTSSASPPTPPAPQKSIEGLNTALTNPDTLKSRHWENHNPYEAFPQQTFTQEMGKAMWGVKPPWYGDEETSRKIMISKTTQLQGFVTISVPTATIARHGGTGGDEDEQPPQQVTDVKRTTVWHTKTETQTRFLERAAVRHSRPSQCDGCGDPVVESATGVLEKEKEAMQRGGDLQEKDEHDEVKIKEIWRINRDRRGVPATPFARGGKGEVGGDGEVLWGTAQTVTTSTSATLDPPATQDSLNAEIIADGKHGKDIASVQTPSPLIPAAIVPGIPKHLTTAHLPSPSHQRTSKMYTGRVCQELDPLLLELLNPTISPTSTITQPPTPSPSLNRWNRVPSFEAEWVNNSTEPWEFGFELPNVPAPLVWLLFLGLALGAAGSAVVYLVNFPPAFLSMRAPSRRADDEQGRGRYQGFENGSPNPMEPPPSAVSTAREFEGAAALRRTRARHLENGIDAASSPSAYSYSKSGGESPTGRTPLLHSSSTSSHSTPSPSPSPPRSPPSRWTPNRNSKKKQEILLSPLGTPFPAAEPSIPLLPLPPRDKTAHKMRAELRPHPLNLTPLPTDPRGRAIPRSRTGEDWIAARAAFASQPSTPRSLLAANESDIEAQTPHAQLSPLMKKTRSGFGLAAFLPSAMSLPASPVVRWSSGGAAWLESIDGAVGRVVGRVARFTADEGGEGGLVLPTRE
ncbi:hypothetical protein BU16DRAFT_560567 [Lophium mytilinum]|uniref:Uncharacterized protein n=1 Tax=Lophium mytilinum TaxID=390894 RepID=A0A6A6QYE8_9PEZI|nr:hypothetical protein BU16DRAFT_560567 [Lophium mytilinum]